MDLVDFRVEFVGLSSIGTLKSRNLSVAYVPQNLSEGAKEWLLRFWPARVRCCQVVELCLRSSRGTKVVRWPWFLKNKPWKGNVLGVKKIKNTSPYPRYHEKWISIFRSNSTLCVCFALWLIKPSGCRWAAGWSWSLQAQTRDAHCDSAACPHWALEKNCKQCKTLNLLHPNAVKGDEQSAVLTFLLLPLWEALGTY